MLVQSMSLALSRSLTASSALPFLLSQQSSENKTSEPRSFLQHSDPPVFTRENQSSSFIEQLYPLGRIGVEKYACASLNLRSHRQSAFTENHSPDSLVDFYVAHMFLFTQLPRRQERRAREVERSGFNTLTRED